MNRGRGCSGILSKPPEEAFVAIHLRECSRIVVTLNPEPIRKAPCILPTLGSLKYEVFHCKIQYSGCTAVILDTNLVCFAPSCDFRAATPREGASKACGEVFQAMDFRTHAPPGASDAPNT